jgi:hypothetical protein
MQQRPKVLASARVVLRSFTLSFSVQQMPQSFVADGQRSKSSSGSQFYFTGEFAQSLSDGEIAPPLQYALRRVYGETSILSEVVYERGSFPITKSVGLTSFDPSPWGFLEVDDTGATDQLSQNEDSKIVPYSESTAHSQLIAAEKELQDLLATPEMLLQKGPEPLRAVLGKMGLERSDGNEADVWEKAAIDAFGSMYEGLVSRCPYSKSAPRHARNAETAFREALQVRRKVWSKVRSRIFTKDEPLPVDQFDGHSATIRFAPSVVTSFQEFDPAEKPSSLFKPGSARLLEPSVALAGVSPISDKPGKPKSILRDRSHFAQDDAGTEESNT